jgi:hypothetical protein
MPDFRLLERPRLLKYIDHVTFPKVVGEIVRHHPVLKRLTYAEEHLAQDQVRDLPRLVWRLKRRTPGKQGLEPYKGRLRPDSTWRNDDGTFSQLYAQYMTCLWQFDVVAGSGAEANELLQEFEHAMLESLPLFKQLGMDDLLFDEQLEDDLLRPTGDAQIRSIRFRTFMEQIRIRTLGGIDEVRIRVFEPQEESWETVVRGTGDYDVLSQTHIAEVLCVADAQPDGIARAAAPVYYAEESLHNDPAEYVVGTDYVVLHDPNEAKAAIQWLPPGRKPVTGASYDVRYLFWTAFATLYLPA